MFMYLYIHFFFIFRVSMLKASLIGWSSAFIWSFFTLTIVCSQSIGEECMPCENIVHGKGVGAACGVRMRSNF